MARNLTHIGKPLLHEVAAELYTAASALHYYGLEVFDESRLKVTLIEAGSRILPALPSKLADAAREELEALAGCAY
ncbi:MAG: hypothetical protein WA446_07085 [Steroidobacteraceae bacterium]